MCVCVCGFVRTVTFELNDLRSSTFGWFIGIRNPHQWCKENKQITVNADGPPVVYPSSRPDPRYYRRTMRRVWALLADEMSHFPEQSRARFVVVYPTPDGVQCPQLTETRPCTSLPRCVSHHWQVSAWSTCMFVDVNDRCGDHGYRLRGI